MTGFFFKKNFCDIWDNLFFLILSNILPVAAVIGSYFAVAWSASVNEYLPLVMFVVCCGFVMSVIFAWGANARKIADFNSAKWSLFVISFKNSFFTGFLFGVLIAFICYAALFSFRYYLGSFFSTGSMVYVLLAAVTAWFFLIAVMALQWFIPLYFLQEENNFIKCLKKSFIIYFDNGKFSLLMLLNIIVLSIITVLTFGLIPGVCGILLSETNALRLRLYKYDWYEGNPEVLNDREKRSDIPWEELLEEDRESLGPRTIKSFFSPWK